MNIETASNEKQQCWECKRRRMVCDFARPGCNKCKRAGTECPGYGEIKPVRWNALGKVTSKTRRRRLKASECSENSLEKSEKNAQSDGQDPSCQGLDNVKFGSPGVELRDETCTIVEAAYYYNTRVYPDRASINALSGYQANAFIIPVNLDVLHVIPESVRHICVSTALRHHISKTAKVTSHGLTSREYYHRGQAIHALSDEIKNTNTRTSDMTMCSITVILGAEVWLAIEADWRQHFQALLQIISLRGGLKKLALGAPHLQPLLLYFILVGIIGNTTCPPADQVAVELHHDHMSLIDDLYTSSLFPNFLCPPPLFLDIIQINHLRFRAATTSPTDASDYLSATMLLEHIKDFSPEVWATSHASCQDDWRLIARIYKPAVVLYCLLSLQNVSLLPLNLDLLDVRTVYADQLLLSLHQTSASPEAKKMIMWPLIVAGIAVTKARPFVAQQLEELSRDLGTPMPLMANVVLEKFWASGMTGWDDCFDRPYAFVA